MRAVLAALITLWTIVQSILLFIPERILWLIGMPLVAIALPFAHKHDTKKTRDGKDLLVLPFWADWCWGNSRDGMGDWSWATVDNKYKSLEDYNENGSFWDKWRFLAARNPCHNLNENLWIYHCDFRRINNCDYFGTAVVDNRYDKDGKLTSGFNVVYCTGSWLYLRSGLFLIVPLWKGKCLRCRIGFKCMPSHFVKDFRDRDKKVLWTFSPFSIKSIIAFQ